MPFCRMCALDKPALVESHIVPKAIVLDSMSPVFPSIRASTDAANYPGRLRIGYYSEIVCDECEKSFGPDDDFLIDVCRTLNSVRHDGNLSYLDGVDPLRLQRSILCVLYRAHLSDIEAYRAVKLGIHAESLRQFVSTKGELQAPSGFAVVLMHRLGKLAGTIFGAEPSELAGAVCVATYIPPLTALIKFDIRDFEEPMRSFQVSASRPVMAQRVDGLIASEHEVVQEIDRTQGPRIRKMLGGMLKKRKR